MTVNEYELEGLLKYTVYCYICVNIQCTVIFALYMHVMINFAF